VDGGRWLVESRGLVLSGSMGEAESAFADDSRGDRGGIGGGLATASGF